MDNERLLTFSEIGFKDFISILIPVQPEGAYQYTRMKMKKDIKMVADFMMRSVVTYMQSAGENHDFTGEFLGGVVYFMDGSQILVYNGMKGEETKITASFLEADHYTKVSVPEGESLNDNIDYTSQLFNVRYPKALALLQEVESEDPESYVFRIIHDRDIDCAAK